MDSTAGASIFKRVEWIMLLLLILFGLSAFPPQEIQAQPVSDESVHGVWRVVRGQSSPIDPWTSLRIHLDAGPRHLTLIRRWHGPTNYTAVDSVHIPIDGRAHRAPLPKWPDNRHLGAFAAPDRPRRVAAEWLDDGRTLRLTSRFCVDTSQGQRRVRTSAEYRISPGGDRLVLLELRSTRPTARRYVLERIPVPNDQE